MTDYKLHPNLPSAPPENPQVAYHLSVIRSKMQGLKNKEQIFKQKYEKYNKILNRLTWLNARSSRISVALEYLVLQHLLHSSGFQLTFRWVWHL